MKNKHVLFLFIFSFLLYGIFSAFLPFLDPDEPVYGETAREMLLTGNWLSPQIYGNFWFDKPPLFYWLDALSFSMFGVSAWAARLPSALMGAATVSYLYLSTRNLIGEKPAFYGSFICATTLETALLARSAVTDMTLTFTLTVALISFLRKEYIPAYIFCGLALLAKGPVGFAFPAVIVFLWLALSHQFSVENIMSLKWYWGIPLACFVGLPWFIYMGITHGSVFIDTFFGYHNLARFTTPEHAEKNHIWLFFVVFILGFFPWSGTIPGILRRLPSWKKDSFLLFFTVWAAFIFIFFSLSSTQLFSYILPMFPPASVLAGKYLAEWDSRGEKTSSLFLCTHLFFTVLTAAAVILAPVDLGESTWKLWCLSFFLIASGFISSYFFKTKHLKRFMISQAAMLGVFIFSVSIFFSSAISSLFCSENIAQKLLVTEREDRPVYIDTFYRPSIAFYSHIYGEPLPSFDRSRQEEAQRQKEKGVDLPTVNLMTDVPANSYILIQRKIFEKWPNKQKKGLELLWEKDTALFFKKSPVTTGGHTE